MLIRALCTKLKVESVCALRKLKIENGKLKVVDLKYYYIINSSLSFNFHLSTFNLLLVFLILFLLTQILFYRALLYQLFVRLRNHFFAVVFYAYYRANEND